MLDYQRPDSGWCGDRSRGAGMGRGSDLPLDYKGELRIRRVPMVDGDYDPGGAYWGGGGEPLFLVFDHEDGLVRYLRAADLEMAKAEFPRATFHEPDAISESDIEDMFHAYVETALWSSNDESNDQGGDPLDDNYSESDIAPETLASMRADVEKFARENAKTIVSCIGKRERGEKRECDWALAGHDFWLNRNGHGCGFWDGGWPKEAGAILSDAADKFETVNLYVGDDGQVHS